MAPLLDRWQRRSGGSATSGPRPGTAAYRALLAEQEAALALPWTSGERQALAPTPQNNEPPEYAAMVEAFARWEALETENGPDRVTSAEVAAAQAYKAAYEAYVAAVKRERGGQQP